MITGLSPRFKTLVWKNGSSLWSFELLERHSEETSHDSETRPEAPVLVYTIVRRIASRRAVLSSMIL